jgi:hypothetical protein
MRAPQFRDNENTGVEILCLLDRRRPTIVYAIVQFKIIDRAACDR